MLVNLQFLREAIRGKGWHLRYYFYLRFLGRGHGGRVSLSLQDIRGHAEYLSCSERTVWKMKRALVQEGLLTREKGKWHRITGHRKLLTTELKIFGSMPMWALESKENFISFAVSAHCAARVKSINTPKVKIGRDRVPFKTKRVNGPRNVGEFAGVLVAEDFGVSPQTACRWLRIADGKFQKIVSRKIKRFKDIRSAVHCQKSIGGKLLELSEGWGVQRGYIRAFCVSAKYCRYSSFRGGISG